MRPKSIMVIAGEASGDQLAAELVQTIREELAAVEAAPTADYQPLRASLEPRFFGAGGPRMRAAGVSLALEMTEHSVVGFSDVVGKLAHFRRIFNQLCRLAREQEPDAVICVDFSGFNSRLAHAIKRHAASRHDWFHDWDPKFIQFVSPQVWASREGRAYRLARDFDLVLSIFPFEKEWYAKRVPQLRVEFVGHPLIDRCLPVGGQFDGPMTAGTALERSRTSQNRGQERCVLLLPGSRPPELERHVPLLIQTAARIKAALPASFKMVLPNQKLAEHAGRLAASARLAGNGENLGQVEFQSGGLAEDLKAADLAISKSGSVTLECACFGVPTIVFYKTSWSTYTVAKKLVKVNYLAMPNLLAGEEVFPEFIQAAATAENLAQAALDLLRDPERRNLVKKRLTEITRQLGDPGASRRAARAIVQLMDPELAPAR